MKCCLYASVLALSVCGVAMSAPVAPDPGIPANYKSDADPAGNKDEIVQKINAEVGKLANDADAPRQGAARDWLVNEAAASSSAYIELYTDTLNKGLVTLLKNPATSDAVKLNCAIIAARVADSANNAALLPTVMATLTDKSDAVTLKGERAAGVILPAVFKDMNLSQKQGPALLNAIVKSVSDHSTSLLAGAIAEDAYGALNPTSTDVLGTPATVSALADAIIQLQQNRQKLYITGIPQSPGADAPGSLFLLDTKRWSQLSKAQHVASVQNAVNLIWLAAQRAAALPANQSEDLIHSINNEGILLDGLATAVLNSPDLQAVVVQIEREKLPIGSPASLILTTCRAVFPAVQKSSPDFAALVTPPDLAPLPKAGK